MVSAKISLKGKVENGNLYAPQDIVNFLIKNAGFTKGEHVSSIRTVRAYSEAIFVEGDSKLTVFVQFGPRDRIPYEAILDCRNIEKSIFDYVRNYLATKGLSRESRVHP